jgi:hypothetical protein
MVDRTDKLLTIQRLLPAESQQALSYFVELNSKMDGADWADALDMLCETDSHCDITDHIYEECKAFVPIDGLEFVVPLTITMIYSRRGTPPFFQQVAYLVGYVQGRLEQEAEDARAVPVV